MADSDITRYGRKVMSYFFDSAPVNDQNPTIPIYCLGVRYDPPDQPVTETNVEPVIIDSPSQGTTQSSELTSEPEEITRSQAVLTSVDDESETELVVLEKLLKDDTDGWPTAFLDDFESRIWMTYRSNFAPIARSQDPKASASLSLAVRLRSLAGQEGFTSDTGWGCMIRSGQSLLSNTLLVLEKGRDWRTGSSVVDERKILADFADDPRAPFSIHNFVAHGAAACGKYPGEWFGPSATAKCIQALVNRYRGTTLSVYVTSDGSDVFEDAVFRIATARTGSFEPVLVLVGTRLGIERVTPVYWEALKAALQIPQAMGIAGGRPSASHYFVGTQANDFFYLDPHHTRPALPLHTDLQDYTPEELATCHTRRLRRLNIDGMDPSMLLGFLIRDEGDWKDWRQNVTKVSGKPILHVHDREFSYATVSRERHGAIDEVESFDTEEDP